MKTRNKNKKYESLLKKRNLTEERKFERLCLSKKYEFAIETQILKNESKIFANGWLKNWKPETKPYHSEDNNQSLAIPSNPQCNAPISLPLVEDPDFTRLDLNTTLNETTTNPFYKFYIFKQNLNEIPKDPVIKSPAIIKKI